MDPGLPPDHTGTAELDIEEERNRRLAERVSKRIEAEAITKAMLKQIPARKLIFDDEPTNTGASSSSSGGMSGYIAGVPAVVGGAGKAARAVAGAVGALKPGEVVGTIAGGTIGAAAIGAVEAGRGLYHTGATAGGMLVDYLLGGDGEEAPEPASSMENTPQEKKKSSKKTGLAKQLESSPESEHEPKGSAGKPISEETRQKRQVKSTQDPNKVYDKKATVFPKKK